MTEREMPERPDDAAPAPRLLAFVAGIADAKRLAGSLYLALLDVAPGPTGAIALRQIAEDESDQARALDALRGVHAPAAALQPAVAPGCGVHDQNWGSGLMTAFALDQAATAALVALATSVDRRTAALAERIVGEERQHERFALGAFRVLADAEAGLGMRLAKEMIENRDWIKGTFPRRTTISALADAGFLAPDAARRHDSFLASLGDRIQDALGVLGEL